MHKDTLRVILKEIGRGKNAARDISRDDARALFAAMLAGDVPPLQLGAALMALRIKGESLEELAGFLDAAEASYSHLTQPQRGVPVVIPAYNGARKLPNLTPLLALLVAREGVPVLIHGVTTDAGRVTTCEVLRELGIAPAQSIREAGEQLAARNLAFIAIGALAPNLAKLLALRGELGVRGSGHTIVKMMQPFAVRAVRLVSVTHPDYHARMREFFTHHAAHALILRGAEGEAVAHPRREAALTWADGAEAHAWSDNGTAEFTPCEDRDAAVTARWIERALRGEVPLPVPLAHQVRCCVRASRLLAQP
jgi:anthranilate phosphoribosyltransferase